MTHIKKKKVHILITYLHIFFFLSSLYRTKKNKTRSKNIRKKCSQFDSRVDSKVERPYISNTFFVRIYFHGRNDRSVFPRIIFYTVTTHRVYSRCTRDDVADNCEHEPRYGGS